MIAKTTAPPFSSLNDTQKLIVTALQGRSKSNEQLEKETKRNYHPVNRALRELRNKGWVEIDPDLSGGKTNFYRLKQVPSDGIEVIVTTDFDRESISFNRYIESVAKQLASGKRPKLERELEGYFKGIAMLGYYAAKEFLEEDSVAEAQLLEVRSAIQRFVMSLEEAYMIGNQILEDERIWHANSLANGVMRKTDRHLTPAELVGYCKMISGAFSSTEPDETNNEQEEEQDSAEDYA